MRTVTSFMLCMVCIAAGCSKDNVEPSKANAVVKTKEQIGRSFWFPEASRQWTRTIGKNLPARIENLPMGKATVAKKVIYGVSENFLEIITNRTDKEVREIIHRIDDVTDDLGYNLCGQYLWQLKYAFENLNFHKDIMTLELPPNNFSRNISNYCCLANAVADLSWTKAGRCFFAQSIDYCQFLNLKRLSRTCQERDWAELQPVVDKFKQEWIEKRFDAPNCHLRIACDEIGEDAELDKTGLERPWSIRGRYDNPRIFFAVKAVGRYPKWLKGVVLDDEGKVYDPSKKSDAGK